MARLGAAARGAECLWPASVEQSPTKQLKLERKGQGGRREEVDLYTRGCVHASMFNPSLLVSVCSCLCV